MGSKLIPRPFLSLETAVEVSKALTARHWRHWVYISPASNTPPYCEVIVDESSLTVEELRELAELADAHHVGISLRKSRPHFVQAFEPRERERLPKDKLWLHWAGEPPAP